MWKRAMRAMAWPPLLALAMMFVCGLCPALAHADDAGKTAAREPQSLVAGIQTQTLNMVELPASGTSGTCTWEIDANGALVVRPSDGVEGTLEDWGAYAAPWLTSVGESGMSAEYNYLTSARFEGTVHAPRASMMFSGCTNLTQVDLSGLDTSSAQDMNAMFWRCEKLVQLDLSGLDTSSAQDMSNMFTDCNALESLDVSGFDTSNVTNMDAMFNRCTSLTELDVSGFDTSNVTNMEYLFNGCENLTQLDASKLDTSGVTNMRYMFADCAHLQSLDLRTFDTSKVTDVSGMFYRDYELTTLLIDGWDFSNVTRCGSFAGYCTSLDKLDLSGANLNKIEDLRSLFYECGAANVDLSNADLSALWDLHSLFSGCGELKTVSLAGADISQATTMAGMFWGCEALTELDLTGVKTGRISDLQGAFAGCASLASLDLSTLNVGSSCNVQYAFEGCRSLESLALPDGFVGNGVDNISRLFSGCSSLAAINFAGWDTSGVKQMDRLFYGCSSLTSLDLSGLDTSQVVDMSGIFEYCSSLKSLDLSPMNTSNVTKMNSMFYGCSSLAHLDLSSLDTSQVTNMSFLCEGCEKLESVKLEGLDTSQVTDMHRMFKNCYALKTVDFTGFDTSHVVDIDELLLGASALVSANFGACAFNLDLLQDYGSVFDWRNSSLASVTVSDSAAKVLLPQLPEGTWKREDGKSFNCEGWGAAYEPTDADGGTWRRFVPGQVGVRFANAGELESIGKGDKILAQVEVEGAEDVTFSWSSSDPQVMCVDQTGVVEGIGCGTAYLTVSVEGSDATATLAIEVRPDITDAEIWLHANSVWTQYTGDPLEYVYTGDSIEPELDLVFEDDNLVKDVDYKLSYRDNKMLGMGVVVIKGIRDDGRFKGERELCFNIVQPDSAASIEGISIDVIGGEFDYTGNAVVPEIDVYCDDRLLAEGVDYTLTLRDNVQPGTATATVTLIRVDGTPGDKKDVTFTILAPKLVPINSAVVNGITSRTYTGQAQTQSVVVTLGGKELVAGTDYKVSYANNVNAGSAKLTVTGIGSYTGSVTKSFTINKVAPAAKAKKASVAIKLKKVKKKAQTVKNLSVGNAGKVSYKSACTGKTKKWKVNAKTGAVTVPKGTKKGTYTVKVKVTCKADANHGALTRTVSFKVKVK